MDDSMDTSGLGSDLSMLKMGKVRIMRKLRKRRKLKQGVPVTFVNIGQEQPGKRGNEKSKDNDKATQARKAEASSARDIFQRWSVAARKARKAKEDEAWIRDILQYWSGAKDAREKEESRKAREDKNAREDKKAREDEEARKAIRVIDGERTCYYSVEEFGKILQLSQWSLSHRIKVCKALQDSNQHWRMSPLSRHVYAKQSLALINSTTPIRDLSLALPELSYDRWLEWQEPREVEPNVFKEWEGLTMELEEELKRSRAEDEQENWYKSTFEGDESDERPLQPCDLYIAIEEGRVDDFIRMVDQIWRTHGWPNISSCTEEEYEKSQERWASVRPKEYRGATLVHWAALHNLYNVGYDHIVQMRMPQSLACGTVCDEFGFKPWSHMIIFSSSWPSFTFRQTEEEYLANVSNLLSSMPREFLLSSVDGIGGCATSISDFLFFALDSKERQPSKWGCFTTKAYFTTPVCPIQLAIRIGHPLVLEQLIKEIPNLDLLVKTSHGDSILHLAAWGMHHCIDDSEHGKGVMPILLKHLFRFPALLNSCNEDEQTPLHIAAFRGDTKCVAALLACPYIKLDVMNKRGLTPCDIAEKLMVSFPNWKWARGFVFIEREIYGLSEFKYNDTRDSYQFLNNYIHRCNNDYEEVLEDLYQKTFQYQRQIVMHCSQWNLRHRILTLQMFDENDANMEKIKGTYVHECLKFMGGLKLNDGNIVHSIERLPINALQLDLPDELRREIQHHEGDYNWKDRDLLQGIYYAVEVGDSPKFERLMDELSTDRWSMSLSRTYKGATPLHWASFYGRTEMVAFICKRIAPFLKESTDTNRRKNLMAIVNAQDEYGFTPLHLAVFGLDPSSDQKVKNCERLIEELYQMGVPHCASNKPDPHFWMWKWPDCIDMDDYLSNNNLYPLHLGVRCACPGIVEKLLESFPEEAYMKNVMSNGDTILHYARGWEVLINRCSKDEWRKIETTIRSHVDNLPKAVNSRNYKRETPLHGAVRTKSVKWVEVLLQCGHINFNLRDEEKLTPWEYADKLLKESDGSALNAEGKRHVEEIKNLIDCYDPESLPRQREIQLHREREEREKNREEEKKRMEKKRQDKLEEKERREAREKKDKEERKETEARQRERQVYVDAANAILVGAALIASASFGAWLQPPLGLHPYPEFLDTSVPPQMAPAYESFVPIQQNWKIQLFWIFNSLSFFFSLATVIAGADAALPHQVQDVDAALTSVKRAVQLAAWLLIAAILSVIGTFATLGFTVLPPIIKYEINMIITLLLGGGACAFVLVKLVKKLCS